jgi:hypothetical protein
LRRKGRREQERGRKWKQSEEKILLPVAEVEANRKRTSVEPNRLEVAPTIASRILSIYLTMSKSRTMPLLHPTTAKQP